MGAEPEVKSLESEEEVGRISCIWASPGMARKAFSRQPSAISFQFLNMSMTDAKAPRTQAQPL